MPNKPIQEQFGEKVIEAFAEFARADLKTAAELRADDFSHVSDAALRTSLAQVLYGARWVYKLGLALLTKDEERAAHVRAQVVDYASVCEALLSDCLAHAIRRGHTIGTDYQFSDPPRRRKPIHLPIPLPQLDPGKPPSVAAGTSFPGPVTGAVPQLSQGNRQTNSLDWTVASSPAA